MVDPLVNIGCFVCYKNRNNISRLYVTHCMYFRLHVYYYYYYYDDDNNNSKNTSSCRVIRINVLDNNISEHAAFVRLIYTSLFTIEMVAQII